MKQDPTTIYKCPNCRQLIAIESIVCSKPMDEIYYSDGKYFGPKSPELIDFVKCFNCRSFFWLGNIKDYFYCNDFEKNEKYNKAKKTTFCTVEEYLEALNGEYSFEKEDEYWLRMELWHSFNNRIRSNEPIFNDKFDEFNYFDNCNKLIEILELDRNGLEVLIAELYRNLGDFEKSISITKEIVGFDFEAASQIGNESKKKNQWLFILEKKTEKNYQDVTSG